MHALAEPESIHGEASVVGQNPLHSHLQVPEDPPPLPAGEPEAASEWKPAARRPGALRQAFRQRLLVFFRKPLHSGVSGVLLGSLGVLLLILAANPAALRREGPGTSTLYMRDQRFPYNASADLARGWGYVSDAALWDVRVLGPLLGPAQWASLPQYPLCSGSSNQSPVALVDATAQPGGAAQLRRLYNSTAFSIGPRVGKPGFQVDPSKGPGEGEWEPPPFGVAYHFEDFHFHSPSEHTLDGESFALEAHFVHKTSAAPQQTSVFSLLYREDTARQRPNPHLRSFWEIQFSPGYSDIEAPLNLTALVDDMLPVYYSYQGSLTAPPCSPATFFVAVSSSPVNTEQLAAFRWRMQLVDSNRPTQPLGGRMVTRYTIPPGPISTPTAAH